MTEKSYWWTAGGGAGDGAATYTRADLAIIVKVLAACCGFEGVGAGLANELAGAVGGANTVNMGTGGGLVDGKPYYSDAVVPVDIPSAVGAGNTRIDRIVLRAGWTAQTVRITRLPGTDAASPVAPTPTWVSGTTYDIQLYQALVDTSGNVTLTDERVWAAVTTNGIGALAVTAAKIANTTITAAKMAANAITNAVFRQSAGLSVVGRAANSTGDVADITAANDAEVLRRSGTSLGFGTVATAGIADNAITAAKIAAAVAGNGLSGGGGSALAVNVDGTTIEINTDALRIKDASITPDKLAATVAGNGLVGGAGSALAVNPDGTTLEINTDAVRVKDLGISTAKLAANAVTNAKFRQSAGLSLVGRSANSTGDVADITGTDGQVARVSGTALGFGQIATAGIADNAITAAKIAATVAGDGLAGGGGVALSVNVDGSTLEINTDALRVKDGGITAAKIANRTRAFLVPVTGGYNSTDAVYVHQASAVGLPLMAAKLTTAWGAFHLPADYASGLTIKAVLGNVATANANIYALNQADHAAAGEIFNTHSDASAYGAVAVTHGQINVIKTVTPSNVTAGDYFLLTFARDGTNGADTLNYYAYLLGWQVEYTADS